MNSHGQLLTVLSRSDPDRIKAFAVFLIEQIGEIKVIESRTGFVILPMLDTAAGTAFHLGEVFMSEAHIRNGELEGYGLRCGRDLEASMAMALVDLAIRRDIEKPACIAFCAKEATAQASEDDSTLRQIEATRINMETF